MQMLLKTGVLFLAGWLCVAGANAQTNTTAADSSASFVIKAEVPPIFRGGQATLQRFINNRMVYPEKARREKIQGDVLLAFHINEKGECSNFRVLKGIGGGCDEEALRVAKEMPRWIPAKTRGKSVAVDMQMPISFRINSSLQLEDNSRTKNKWR